MKMRSFSTDIVLLSVLLCVSGDFSELDNTISEHSLELTQSLNLARQELIQDVCSRFPPKLSLDELPPSSLEHILIDDTHKLLYCYVPKVACTNWKRVLMILGGKWNDTDILSIPPSLPHSQGMFKNLSMVSPEERNFLLENYHKMIIVRNPFERLLSAYRNKLEGETLTAKYFQERVGRRIIKAYRENPTNESLELGNDVTFKEFALFLTSKLEEMADVASNEHWQPITDLCHPCLVKYTLVGKYETLTDDTLLALHTINATHVRFPDMYHTSGTSDKLYSYFSQLDLPLIRKLYKLYLQDYRIFNYDLDNIVGFDLG
ncbi:carbohydrate sulfotransferase 11 [Amyelois transitella]|uniref:carbohydrate sulfotransferase 11 n=1 Tax=Amyelois transitella TaxID=680683 RepID=UPI00298FA5D0|nr:carbohydrate sulfotransferase 11 [Amyelois transitella]